MKKSILIGSLLCVMGLMMSSCTKTEVVNTANWKIVDCNVGYSQWRYTGDDKGGKQYANNYFYASFDLSQITSFIFTDGNVQVYLVEKNSYGEETQRPLPFTRHKEAWDSLGNCTQYTETYDYFYGVGWMEFNYTASDFKYEDFEGLKDRPEGKNFRVVLTW